MADARFPSPGVDARFPEPGTDARFPGPVGYDARFYAPGEDGRFNGNGYGGGGSPPPNTVIRSGQATIQEDMDAVRANTAGKTLLIVGDSLNAGTGAGTGGDELMNGARVRSAPVKAAAALLALGIPARADGWFGHSAPVINLPAEYVAYNPAVVLTSGWDPKDFTDVGVYPMGDANWGAVNVADTITFTPSRAADRFDIYYSSYSGSTGFVVSDSSGTLATVANETGAFSYRKIAVTRAAADTTPIVITPNASLDGPYISGIDPWNSTLAEVRVLSIAVAGWITARFTGNAGPQDIKFGMQLIAPDITIIELGYNDFWTAVALSTAETNLQTIINTFPGAGQILCLPNHATVDDLPAAWRDGMTDLAIANNLSQINFNDVLNTTTDLADTVHPSEAGATKMGDLMAELLAYEGSVPPPPPPPPNLLEGISWTAGASTESPPPIVSGRARAVRAGSSPRIYKQVTLVSGATYRVRGGIYKGTASGDIFFRVATDTGMISTDYTSGAKSTDFQVDATFVVTGTSGNDATRYVGLVAVAAVDGQYAEIDDDFRLEYVSGP